MQGLLRPRPETGMMSFPPSFIGQRKSEGQSRFKGERSRLDRLMGRASRLYAKDVGTGPGGEIGPFSVNTVYLQHGKVLKAHVQQARGQKSQMIPVPDEYFFKVSPSEKGRGWGEH